MYSVHHVHSWHLKSQKRTLEPLELVTDGCELLGTQPGPLEGSPRSQLLSDSQSHSWLLGNRQVMRTLFVM